MASLLPEVRATISALRAVRNPRFLATERGFHGAFYCALRTALARRKMLAEGCILEMEYQKARSRHGITQRPDILFHIPAEWSGSPVTANNFAAWALKHSGTAKEAQEDFMKLGELLTRMKYRLCFFINVESAHPRLERCPEQFISQIHAFATPSTDGQFLRHQYLQEGQIVDNQIAL